jgi:NAD(P)-dependent dehydrogenase (short-subunit alcohol dehydrogenase family)
MLLNNKTAIIYGAGGSIGAAVAKTFARDGATVFLTGRGRDKLDMVAEEITAAGGRAEVAVVDALDERAVGEHADAVAAKAGHIDVSLNLITRGDVQGIPMTEMTVDDFIRPITTGITTNLITAKAALRHMVPQGSGVILTLNSGSAHGSTMMGGTGPADAALDTFVRNLAAEVGPHGIRVLGIWTAGIPETLSAEKLSAVNRGMPMDEASFQGLLGHLDNMRMLRRSPRLAQVAEVAAFLASDRAAAITASFVNVTSGTFAS